MIGLALVTLFVVVQTVAFGHSMRASSAYEFNTTDSSPIHERVAEAQIRAARNVGYRM